MTLNAEQRRAVDSRAELRLILAGPGSGKTRTLLEIARSAKVGSRVVMMTFTNAAANEFRTRLMAANDTDHLELRRLAYCGTLHGYCFRVIQRFGGILGYIPGKVGILPESERQPRLSAARAMLGKKRLSDDKLLNDVRLSGMELADRELVHAQYRFDLKRSNMVDYDGILSTARDLLMMPEVKVAVGMQIHLLLVDEYQDSAFIDQTIYEEVPAQQKVYAGDVDQSIYEFRGANPSGFVLLAGSVFANSLTDAEGFKLELNYRSDIEICDAANKLIAHNKNRVEKMIVPALGKPETPRNKMGVQVMRFDNVRDELQWIGQHIAVGPDWTTGVLFRRRYEVKTCRDFLRMMGLPVHVPKFEARPPDWERALLLIGMEVCPNDVLTERYLRLDYSIGMIQQWKMQAAAKNAEFIPKINRQPTPMNVLQYLAMNKVCQETVNLIKGRLANLEPDADLADLLNDLHGYEETPEDCNKDGGIYVGTIHSAKGREWDAVFLPAFEQQVIPGRIAATFAEMGREPVSQQLKAMSDLEEERRLAFVAVTRARHELYITHVDVRQGEWVLTQCEPSQFICEMGL